MHRLRVLRQIVTPILVITALGCAGRGAAKAPASSAAVPADSLEQSRQRYTDQVLRDIAGRDSMLATKVFKNIKALTFQVTALQLLRGMNGFGRSLGVTCTHCHVAGAWDSDSLRAKRVARGMIRLNGTINDALGRIPEFERPVGASCWTCHRGRSKPERMPM